MRACVYIGKIGRGGPGIVGRKVLRVTVVLRLGLRVNSWM